MKHDFTGRPPTLSALTGQVGGVCLLAVWSDPGWCKTSQGACQTYQHWLVNEWHVLGCVLECCYLNWPWMMQDFTWRPPTLSALTAMTSQVGGVCLLTAAWSEHLSCAGVNEDCSAKAWGYMWFGVGLSCWMRLLGNREVASVGGNYIAPWKLGFVWQVKT